MKRTNTKTIVAALRVLVNDIQTDDGVANACIGEAADRLERMQKAIDTCINNNLHLADGDVCTLQDITPFYSGDLGDSNG